MLLNVSLSLAISYVCLTNAHERMSVIFRERCVLFVLATIHLRLIPLLSVPLARYICTEVFSAFLIYP